jgi:hypothetical protein
VEWVLFDFLPLSSPSASRGVADTLPVAAELPRGVEVGRAGEVEGREGREGREDTSFAPVRSSRRLWATLMGVSSAEEGAISSTSISVVGPWEAGTEARRGEGAGWCWAAFDEVGGRLQAGAAGGVERGVEEEGELLEGRGSSSLSSSKVGVVGSVTAASLFVPRVV